MGRRRPAAGGVFVSDEIDIDEELGYGTLWSDPRLCPWCGEAYQVEPVNSALIFRAGGGVYASAGDLKFSRCARDGVLVISS